MTVYEALFRAETVRGWGLERPGMSGYCATELALMALAAELGESQLSMARVEALLHYASGAAMEDGANLFELKAGDVRKALKVTT